MNEELDPEIAALIANSEDGKADNSDNILDNVEEFEVPTKRKSLFSKSVDEVVHGGNGNRSIHEVDLSKTTFDPLDKLVSDQPSEFFSDKTYYKTVLTGENQSAQRVHQVLSKYLTCKDPKDRAVFRQQIVTAYWELIRGMVGKMSSSATPMPKRMLIRFGVLLPSLFKEEQKAYFSKIFLENRTGEPILYTDEWFKEIATGKMTNSATDEKKQSHKTANMSADEAAMVEQSRLMQLQSKNSGKLQSAKIPENFRVQKIS